MELHGPQLPQAARVLALHWILFGNHIFGVLWSLRFPSHLHFHCEAQYHEENQKKRFQFNYIHPGFEEPQSPTPPQRVG